MTFSIALTLLRHGRHVCRDSWHGKGMYLFLIGSEGTVNNWTYTNGRYDDLTLPPFIAMKTASDEVVPWVASHADLLSSDWREA